MSWTDESTFYDGITHVVTVRTLRLQLILTVPGEFEVNLTVLGEREQTPWTLLNIKMLVEDYEIGYGAQLVHPLQLHMLHNVLQSRMDVAKNVRVSTIHVLCPLLPPPSFFSRSMKSTTSSTPSRSPCSWTSCSAKRLSWLPAA